MLELNMLYTSTICLSKTYVHAEFVIQMTRAEQLSSSTPLGTLLYKRMATELQLRLLLQGLRLARVEKQFDWQECECETHKGLVVAALVCSSRQTNRTAAKSTSI